MNKMCLAPFRRKTISLHHFVNFLYLVADIKSKDSFFSYKPSLETKVKVQIKSSKIHNIWIKQFCNKQNFFNNLLNFQLSERKYLLEKSSGNQKVFHNTPNVTGFKPVTLLITQLIFCLNQISNFRILNLLRSNLLWGQDLEFLKFVLKR